MCSLKSSMMEEMEIDPFHVLSIPQSQAKIPSTPHYSDISDDDFDIPLLQNCSERQVQSLLIL